MIDVVETPILYCYVVVAWGCLITAVVTRWRIRRGSPRQSAGDLSTVEIAYLGGRSDWVLEASIAELRAAGAILVTPTGNAGVTGPLPPGSSAVTHAVHDAARRYRSHQAISNDKAVAAATFSIRDTLITNGWLVSDRQKRRWSRGGYVILGMTFLGLVACAGALYLGDRVTLVVLAYTFLSMLGATIVLLDHDTPNITRAAGRAVRDCRARNSHLAPQRSPSWEEVGPAGAALGAALFGPAARRASDPTYTGRPRQRPGPPPDQT